MTVVGVCLDAPQHYGVLISETDEYGGRDFMYLEEFDAVCLSGSGF